MTLELPAHLAVSYPRAFEILTDSGRTFPPIPRPVGLRKRADKACFRNAFNVASQDPSMGYAEGFAVNHLGMWFQHAWNVTAEGQAVDVTWRTLGVEYVGLVIPTKTVAEIVLETSTFGSALERL